MRIALGYEISHTFSQPTPMIALLNVHYSRASDLEAPDVMTTEPPVPYTSYRDGFGNWCNRLLAPAGEFTVRAATVIRDDGALDVAPQPGTEQGRRLPVEELPEETLVYLLASRFCESDRLSQTAWDLFGGLEPGWAMVQAISRYTHQRITFDYQAARPTMSAWEVHESRRGVCRDFAHLGVALCRAMNVPARYCTGYLGWIGVPAPDEPMDFSGWFEVYLSGGWFVVDPRNLMPRIGRTLVARGRDAADVALTTTFGPSWLSRFQVTTEEL